MTQTWLALLFAMALRCTGWDPVAGFEPPADAIPWQVRCGAALHTLLAEAAIEHPILAGMPLDFHAWPGDNFTYHTVSLRAGPSHAIVFDVSRHDPPIAHEPSAGWQRRTTVTGPTWTRSTALNEASVVVPEPGDAPLLSFLQRAADRCLADDQP